MKKFATRENVAIACYQLHQKGINPTIEKLREELGGGSPGFIGKYLKEWKKANKDTLSKDEGVEYQMPPEALESFRAAWNIASSIANKNLINNELSERDKHIEQIEKENKEMRSLLDQYKAKLEEITKMNKELVNALNRKGSGEIAETEANIIAALNTAKSE